MAAMLCCCVRTELNIPVSPFTSNGLPGPWAATVDEDDNVWISNFAMADSPITELCGVSTENCPPGFKTGDQGSPPGGYVGGGLQIQTDLDIGPAGDVWVMGNWQNINGCFGDPDEAFSTQCGGQGVTVFFEMAKAVRATADRASEVVLIFGAESATVLAELHLHGALSIRLPCRAASDGLQTLQTA